MEFVPPGGQTLADATYHPQLVGQTGRPHSTSGICRHRVGIFSDRVWGFSMIVNTASDHRSTVPSQENETLPPCRCRGDGWRYPGGTCWLAASVYPRYQERILRSPVRAVNGPTVQGSEETAQRPLQRGSESVPCRGRRAVVVVRHRRRAVGSSLPPLDQDLRWGLREPVTSSTGICHLLSANENRTVSQAS